MLLNVSTFLHCRAFSVYSYTETIPCKVVHTMITNKHQTLEALYETIEDLLNLINVNINIKMLMLNNINI